MPDPEIDIRVNTSSDNKGTKDAAKEIDGLKKSAEQADAAVKKLNKSLSEDTGAARGAKRLKEEVSAVEGVVNKVESKIKNTLFSAAWGAALGFLAVLISKVKTEIQAITDLLPRNGRSVSEVNGKISETSDRANDAAEALEKLAEGFKKASSAGETLRQQQDELGDEELAADIAGVDALEAAGVIPSSQARLLRTSLRLSNSFRKAGRARDQLAEEENVLRAGQAKTGADLFSAEVAEKEKVARREALLDQASQVLQVDKEQLRDPKVFEQEFNRAMERTKRFQAGFFSVRQLPPTEDDLRRRAEIQQLSPLLPLLSSPTRRIDRAKERFDQVNQVAGERLPEIDRQKRLLELRESRDSRASAADTFSAQSEAGTPVGGARVAVSQAIQQQRDLMMLIHQLVGVGRGNAAEISQLRSQVTQLQRSLRNDPYNAYR